MKRLLPSATLLTALLLSSGACSQRQQDQAQANTEQATDKTKDATDSAAAKTKDAAQDATDKTKDATKKAGDELSEAGLTGKVKSKLAADVKLSTLTSINVDSEGSAVTLTGHVPTAADRKLAERVAHSVDGVAKVNNKLTIAP